MQVCYLAEDLFCTGSVSCPISSRQEANQQKSHDSRRRYPRNTECAAAWFCFNSSLYHFAELRAGSESFSNSLNAAFHLDARKRIGPAGRTGVHMAIEVVHLF